MIEYLVFRVMNKKLEFSKVPAALKADVKKALDELGLGNLAE